MGEDKKKVLILTTVSGFLPQFELENVKLLLAEGYEVHYASNFEYPVYRTACDYQGLGIRLHPIPIRKSPLYICQNIRALIKLRTLLRREGFCMVHCHNPVGGFLGRIADIGLRKKPWMIYTAHGFHFYRKAPVVNWMFIYPLERILAHRTNCLITINHEDYSYAKRFRLRKQGFAAYCPGTGIRMERIRPAPEGQEHLSREKLGIPKGALFLLSVGELNRNKNHIAVIKAMGLLQDKEIYYGICGAGTAKYKRRLLEAAEGCGVGSHLRLFGYQQQIGDYLALADVFVFPSWREGLGMAALEAMAAGLPVIAADNRGVREYMIDKSTGIMVKPADVRGFADAILQMKDKSLRQRMGRNGKIQAERFQKERTVEAMRNIYQKCEEGMKHGGYL